MPLSSAEIIQHLQNIEPDEFEHFIGDLWERLGWETEVTTGSSDRGIDVIAKRFHPYQQKILIQAKRYQSDNRVGSPQIREYSSLRQQEENVDQVLVVTTSAFTSEARAIASDLNVKCINGEQLAQLVEENDAMDLVETTTGGLPPSSSAPRETDAKSRGRNRETAGLPRGIGDDVIAELLGIARVNFSSESDISRHEMDFDGLFVALTLHTRSLQDSVWLAIGATQEVDVVDSTGSKHNPISLSEKPLRNGWQTHDPEVRTQTGPRNLDIDIRIQETTKYLLAVDLSSIRDLSRIEIDRYGIEIDFTEVDLADTLSLPDDLKTSLESVRGVSIHTS
ncbi:restriction endonuclease [Halorubrum aethiopicum]|uniref:restriction endonuclease n=1 Tax=Halorubrum aethiopicum TaxID=1758255 RepID=UPI0009B59D29|nr:restriction endonuclease [Halorubrum aethiopicum]